jgi:hypothetical protein
VGCLGGETLAQQKKMIYSWNYKFGRCRFHLVFSCAHGFPPSHPSTPFHHVAPFEREGSSGHIFTRSLSSSGANRASNTYQCLSTVLEWATAPLRPPFTHMSVFLPCGPAPLVIRTNPTGRMSHARVFSFSSTGPTEQRSPTLMREKEEENTSTAEYRLRR